MIIRRPVSLVMAAALAVSLAAVSAPPALAGHITWDYPSTDCPTNGTHGLQDCIDNKALSGDTIVIVVDALAGESPTIAKSLTLEAQAGLDPVLGALTVNDLGASQPISVLVQGLTFIAQVTATFSVVDGNSLTLRDVGVTEQGTGADFGMFLDAAHSATFAVIHSQIVFGAEGGVGIDTSLRSPPRSRSRRSATGFLPMDPSTARPGLAWRRSARLRCGQTSSTTWSRGRAAVSVWAEDCCSELRTVAT